MIQPHNSNLNNQNFIFTSSLQSHPGYVSFMKGRNSFLHNFDSKKKSVIISPALVPSSIHYHDNHDCE